MRTSTISKAVAMAAISLSGAPVFAQSTLTMYGLLDQAVEWSDGTRNASNNQRGASGWQLVNGISNGSRFGVRGSEDLGGGLKAIFAIETRFNVDNGDTGGGRGIPPNPSDKKSVNDAVKFWNAQSWVGLDSSSWGRSNSICGRHSDAGITTQQQRIGHQSHGRSLREQNRGINIKDQQMRIRAPERKDPEQLNQA